MEDSYFYKIRSIENELMWIDRELATTGFFKVMPSEEKRRSTRKMITNIRRYVESIQSRLGTEFVSEFQDA